MMEINFQRTTRKSGYGELVKLSIRHPDIKLNILFQQSEAKIYVMPFFFFF